jgi:hypothetical protein
MPQTLTLMTLNQHVTSNTSIFIHHATDPLLVIIIVIAFSLGFITTCATFPFLVASIPKCVYDNEHLC